MSEFFKVAIVGAGNVGWHLALSLENAGHYVTDIYSRHLRTAKALSKRLYNTSVTGSLNLSQSDAEIFLVAVSDEALEEVSASIKIPPHAIIAHTSGAMSLNILSEYHENSGIFYPLQTFTKGHTLDFKKVPICIESVHQSIETVLHTLGSSISNEVYSVTSEDRKVLHVAAVFASNFGNYMLTIAQDILEEHDIDFELLHPLIVETIDKALNTNPAESQTGPARRGDIRTIQKHLKFLRYEPKLRKIYKLLSASLKENYS